MGVVEHHGRVMASELQIAVALDGRLPDGQRLISKALDHVEHLEDRWSRFRASSDITRINKLGSAGGGELKIDPTTCLLLESMIEGVARSAGRFDPTRLRSLLEAGYTTSVEDPSLVCALEPEPGLSNSTIFDLKVDVDCSTVAVPPGLALDPGGIGKGLAADLVAELLVDSGVTGALVSIGGDLSCWTRSPLTPLWQVEVEQADDPRSTLTRLSLAGGGVATSSVLSRRWDVNGSERHHLIDPRTGRCSETDLDSVTVVASSGWLAEVHATAALLAGSAEAVPYLVGHGLSGIAQVRGGELRVTPDVRDPGRDGAFKVEQELAK